MIASLRNGKVLISFINEYITRLYSLGSFWPTQLSGKSCFSHICLIVADLQAVAQSVGTWLRIWRVNGSRGSLTMANTVLPPLIACVWCVKGGIRGSYISTAKLCENCVDLKLYKYMKKSCVSAKQYCLWSGNATQKYCLLAASLSVQSN